MFKALVASGLLVAFLPAEPPADYYQATKDQRGEELRQTLHDLIDDHTALEYRDTREAIAAVHEDPENPANLIQIYTRRSVPKVKVDMWNREHLWPRSRGNTDKRGPDDTDLHHVYPSDYDVNGKRASLLFDITQPPRPANFWSMDEDSFQPPAIVAGDIARALFYMAVRYDGSDFQTSDLTLVSADFNGAEMGNLKTLLQWHEADPPDANERRRNDLIFEKFQHNRNPFIDHPEFAGRIWGLEATSPSFPSPDNDDKIPPICAESSSSPSSPHSVPAPTEPTPKSKEPSPVKP
ncbi:endonuclease I family protein [Roseibacillus persicicus]|uniref:endonuclease I family protein n=1 Tax=Roseibacillus persicicus TaxID=454148 RepID=UPI0028106E4B|nr:endonuclease [Roseibacillus persicicus]MDQ8189966.1 endonuclease [Roseibacillus persicicus]